METYYIISKEICLDSNQWSIIVGFFGIVLSLAGFIIAYKIYNRQRRDNAKDAYLFFQSSLPDLRLAIISTIENLEEFNNTLQNDNDDFGNPILSASLNDKLVNKLNIVDLNRFYLKNRNEKYNGFRQFLIDTNFFGDYHQYFTTELSYFRNNYFEKEKTYSKWQLLRSNKFFSSIIDSNERTEYKDFYSNWVNTLNADSDVFEMNNDNQPEKVKNRTLLVHKHIKNLAQDIFPYIEFSEKANEVNLIANEIYSSSQDIIKMKNSMKKVMTNDIQKFKSILINLNLLVEK